MGKEGRARRRAAKKRQGKARVRRCGCGQPAVIICPVCGPECRSCYMAGVEAATLTDTEGLRLEWGAHRPG
jgi:hypothetical protein